MRRVYLFATACILCGAGGAIGSMVGHAFGHPALFMGGLAGGLIAAAAVGWIAARAGWVPRDRQQRTATGAAIGFVIAAGIAMHTLSSPVGPILSTLFIGLGAVLGSGSGRSGVGA